MKIPKEKFFSIGTSLNITQEKLDDFWNQLESKEQAPFSIYLFYFGTLIIISSLAWFLHLGFQIFGGNGLILIGIGYIVLFTYLGNLLWHKREFKTAGGLLITVAVCMVPLIFHGFESRFVTMELATIAAGILALWFYPFPFLTAPIFFAAWLLSIDSAPYQKDWVTIIFGASILIISFILDRMKKGVYAFWGYIFGTLAFWVGINLLLWNNEDPYLFIYLMINLLLMGLSYLLKRTVLMIFGGLGVFIYLSYITYGIFKDWLYFPLILTLIGLGIIYLGILYKRNKIDLFK